MLITRTLVLCAATAVASLFALHAASAASTVQREAAGAFFEARDPSGCVLTRVDISGLRETTLGTGQPGPGVSAAETFITQRNECTDENRLLASETGAQSVIFSANGLAAATLDGRFGLFDYVSNQGFQVEVHLSWRGTGEPTLTHGANQTHAARSAVAEGTITLDGALLASGEAASAAIEQIATHIP